MFFYPNAVNACMGDIIKDTQRLHKPQMRETALRPSARARAWRVLRQIDYDITHSVASAAAVTLNNDDDFTAAAFDLACDDLDAMAAWPGADPEFCKDGLSDADLVCVLRSRGAEKLPANTSRARVWMSTSAARILFTDGAMPAVNAVNDHDAPAVRAEFTVDTPLQDGLIRRSDVPVHITEALLAARCDSLSARLLIKHGVKPKRAARLAANAHQRAVARLCADTDRSRHIEDLAAAMHRAGRLSSQMTARIAGAGHLQFTEYALALRAGISRAKCALMLYAPGDIGFQALVKAARISPLDVHVLQAARQVFRDLEAGGQDYDRAYFHRLMIDSVLALPVEFSDADGDYCLEMLDGLGSLEFH